MIREEITNSIIRFYKTESKDPFEPYVAIATLLWETPEIVWIVGMHGSVTRKLLIELFQFLTDKGVKMVKAHRDSDRVLPFAKFVSENEVVILMEDISKYLTDRK